MENMGRVIHLFVTVFLSNFAAYVVNPAITDVIVEAVCVGGKDECSLAIYLTGFQQAITGLGAVVMMPLIGNLSDVYGRKALLTVPLTLATIPLVILAWRRTTNFFYVYFALKSLTAMVTEGGVMCLALGYLADNVFEGNRVSAFGVLSGVVSAANVCGTVAARLLSTSHIFQIAAAVSIAATVYMRIFLKETSHETDSLTHPILEPDTESNQIGFELSKKINFIREIPSPKDIISLLKSSVTFSLLACVTFFNSLAEAGIQSFLLYFLKARFHFKKDQFADVLLITYIGATVSSMLLDSIAWSAWVPYASASLGFFFALVTPNLRSMISKQTGPNEQGIAQGCILGISSLASLVSPLIYTPLSALFLSEKAPFGFPGFCILCLGFAYLIGFILSIMIKMIPIYSRAELRSKKINDQ
ncbi:hypothetical protein ACJIZ3_007990 [Penstemon smallii]|uniref:Major facilitator superfamily (MFS) profile domain-containing protein n=1 Tax=Penstemon smallii TaxID=265156 RepID=A0ABD3T8I0_9LAMI